MVKMRTPGAPSRFLAPPGSSYTTPAPMFSSGYLPRSFTAYLLDWRFLHLPRHVPPLDAFVASPSDLASAGGAPAPQDVQI